MSGPPRPAQVVTVATAGHVDHGKSALVRAITGTETDRLAEERRRGLTIELGFAHHMTPSGAVLSFIDVPGHSDFIHTMIAGVSAVDVVLLVIDAGEGVMPQTEEHLEVISLLGVTRIVIAIARCDRVDSPRLAAVDTEVAEWASRSGIEPIDVLHTSAVTGEGLDHLVARLVAVGSEASPGDRSGRVRLHIDRAFTIDGAGTVVTGTLEGAPVAPGDDLEIVRTGRRVRVRSVQTHGVAVDTAQPGTRCALNLAGITLDDLERADTLVAPGAWEPTAVVDARLTGVDPRRARGLMLHVGTGRHVVTVAPVGSAHGLTDIARLRIDTTLALTPGDRFVLRSTGQDRTVGGGVVLDIAPVGRASRAQPDGTTDSILAGHGWIDIDRARRLTGRPIEPVVGRHVAALDVVAATIDALHIELGHGPIEVATRPTHEQSLLPTLDGVTVDHGLARLGTRDPALDHPCVTAVLTGGVRPDPPAGVERSVVARLIRLGVFVEHDGIVFHTDALRAVRPHLGALWREHADGFTVSDLRVALGITRKHAVPLAVCLDRVGLTRRSGDRRQPGPSW